MTVGRIAMIDGALGSLDDARVSVLDRGFLYGDSVFETIRTYGGRPFALERHLARLEASASLAYIDIPVPRDTLAGEVLEAVAASGNVESYVRVMITRGQGELGLDPSLAGGQLRAILVAPLEAPPARAYEEGIAGVTFPTRRVADGTAATGAKIGNYLVSVLAMRAARAASAAEALIVDGSGRVVEGATSNVFFAEGGSLMTPPVDAGILPGITRAILLDVARELGVRVVLRSPQVGEVLGFEEIFISSSIRELLSVVRLDGRDVGSGAPGPLYRSLLSAFRSKVRA